MIIKPTDNFLKINVISPFSTGTKLYMLLTAYMEKLINELIEFWISAQRWIVFSQINLADSVTTLPLVRSPLLFKDLMGTCSMAKSVQMPAQKVTLRLSVLKPSAASN